LVQVTAWLWPKQSLPSLTGQTLPWSLLRKGMVLPQLQAWRVSVPLQPKQNPNLHSLL